MSLSEFSSACPHSADTIPDAQDGECASDADARRAAVRRVAAQRPPLTDAQRRRLRPYTAVGIEYPARAA